MPTPVKLTKIDVARRQLKHALELYFNDGDPLIVYILASAAHQVIHDLLEHKGKKSVFFGSDVIKPEHRKEAQVFLRKPYSFTKHADRKGDPEAILDFEPELAEAWLFAAVFGLNDLGVKVTDLEEAFFWWWVQLHPGCVSESSALKPHASIVTPEQIEGLRKHARQGWPSVYTSHMKRPNSMSGVGILWRSVPSGR